MSSPAVHILDQGPVIAALGRVAVAAARQRFGLGATGATAERPLTATVPPRDAELVRDFVRWSGGDPGWYRGVVPSHLFPQWGFPLLGRTLEGISYPLAKVLNAGCRMEINAPLPAAKPLKLEARLEGIEDDGRRALIHQRLATGTDEHPEALVAHVYGLVPLGGGVEKKARDKARPRVPEDAREIGWLKLRTNAGFEFACLTGDFNPVHWVPAYARAAGFGNCILHGFATLARAIETMNRAVFAGDPRRLATIDVKFTRPLRLPAKVGVYVRDGALFVGDAPGGPAYLTGEYTTREGTT